MRFEFCGNLDCPEWVLAEISLVNRLSPAKLKLILAQIVSKITGLSAYDHEKVSKLCKDQKLDGPEVKCLAAILEFCLTMASRHDINHNILNRDLTLLGVAIDNANSIMKTYQENQDMLVKAMVS